MKPDIALALIIKRWRDWQEVARYQLPSQQEAERQNLLELYKLYKKMSKKKSRAIQTQVSTLVPAQPSAELILLATKEKQLKVDNNALVVHMQPTDYENYFDYIRMDVETYNELYKLVEHKIKKQFLVKCCVPAHTRLQICLRYLASGDSMSLISQSFRVANNTVAKIVTETCQAIWDVLKDIVLPLPTKDTWKEKAQAFETLWDFVHCIGAIDKKQLVLQSHIVSETNFYKGNGCLILFAITDANSCFSLINIKIEDMHPNGINFTESETGRSLQNNAYDIPLPSKISENGPELPFVFVGDEDFILTTNTLPPYPISSNLDLSKQVFNYRIGRARKCADCAFHILTNQWKIFHKKFATGVFNTITIVKAVICLHNFLMMKENARPFQDRRYSLLSKSDRKTHVDGLQKVKMYAESPSDETTKVRDIFKDIFCEDGAILLEWE